MRNNRYTTNLSTNEDLAMQLLLEQGIEEGIGASRILAAAFRLYVKEALTDDQYQSIFKSKLPAV